MPAVASTLSTHKPQPSDGKHHMLHLQLAARPLEHACETCGDCPTLLLLPAWCKQLGS